MTSLPPPIRDRRTALPNRFRTRHSRADCRQQLKHGDGGTPPDKLDQFGRREHFIDHNDEMDLAPFDSQHQYAVDALAQRTSKNGGNIRADIVRELDTRRFETKGAAAACFDRRKADLLA